MARNSEKNLTALNRLVLADREGKAKQQQRPPLWKLNTADEIRRWIPSIKADIKYCIRHTSGIRNYTDWKIKEFEQRLEELKAEYKKFVRKCVELDPNGVLLFGTPGDTHGYVSKRRVADQLISSNTQSYPSQSPSSPDGGEEQEWIPLFAELNASAVSSRDEEPSEIPDECAERPTKRAKRIDSSNELIETPLASKPIIEAEGETTLESLLSGYASEES